MKRILDTSEILGTVDLPKGVSEVCASADAGYDQGSGKLVVELKAFLRPTGVGARDEHLSPKWLPRAETISESVSLEEAGEVARDVFHRWVRKVREASPAMHSPSF